MNHNFFLKDIIFTLTQYKLIGDYDIPYTRHNHCSRVIMMYATICSCRYLARLVKMASRISYECT